MLDQSGESDVQKVRAAIEQEAEVLRLLSQGMRTVASHKIIEAAYDRLGMHQEQLEQLIGTKEAAIEVVTALGKETVASLEIEPKYLEETRQVLEQSGGRLEIGDKVIAHLPPGTVKQWFEPRNCYELIFPDQSGLLLVEKDGKSTLLPDFEEYLGK